MANYTTTSGFPDLVGSMVVTNNNVTSYTSNNRGAGTVQNQGGSGLNFNVHFSGVDRPYHINGNLNGSGNGYSGNANNNGPAAAEESWAATAQTGDTADASTAEESVTKQAAS